jgi:hypothetical protein
VRENLSQLAAAWHEAFGSAEMTLAEAAKEPSETLRAAMMAVAGDRDGINGRRLGKYLSRYEGRIEGGRRFLKGEEGRSGILWRVVLMEEAAGLAGFAGSTTTPYAKCQGDAEIDTRNHAHDSYVERGEANPRNPRNPQNGFVEGLI